jgi:FkbM family methyltransferase
MKWLARLKQFRRNILEKRRQKLFFKQGVILHRWGDYQLLAPEKHASIEFMSRQPYRDLCIGIAAKYVCEKYRNGTIVDIGANIGDTASIIASYTKNKMILVEASDFYFDFLQKNSKQLPNEIELVKAFISDGTHQSGELKHWGGTAHLDLESGHKIPLTQTRRLQDITDDDVAFIKIDTDGFDIKILKDSLDYLKKSLPAILFENQIMNSKQLLRANNIFKDLIQIGYKHFSLWDDAGFYITCTSSLDLLKDFNRYLCKIWNYEQTTKSISNYDVLCLKPEDADICNRICDFYHKY